MATRQRENSLCDDMTDLMMQECKGGMVPMSPTSASTAPPVLTPVAAEGKDPKVLSALTLDAVVDYIKNNQCKNIVTMAGAGISTSASIPDFRSPDSGIYSNLEKYNLTNPQAIFTLALFKANPEPFFQLCREKWPKKLVPTPCHFFIRKLHEKGLLVRHYTQNIDTLEHVAGIPSEKVVEAHGTFNTATCQDEKCAEKYKQDWLKEKIMSESGEIPKCDKCGTVVKPDVILFGESLPTEFFDRLSEDMTKCDVLIILGTSLTVQPFASSVNRVPDMCPRLYINREADSDGSGSEPDASYVLSYNDANNKRDVAWWGECDDGCQLLADKLGWGPELKDLVKAEQQRIAETQK